METARPRWGRVPEVSCSPRQIGRFVLFEALIDQDLEGYAPS
jgi:hypothetical protein